MDDIDTKAYKFHSIQPPGLRKSKPEFYVVNCKGEWHHGGALSLSNTFQARGGKGFQAVACGLERSATRTAVLLTAMDSPALT